MGHANLSLFKAKFCKAKPLGGLVWEVGKYPLKRERVGSRGSRLVVVVRRCGLPGLLGDDRPVALPEGVPRQRLAGELGAGTDPVGAVHVVAPNRVDPDQVHVPRDHLHPAHPVEPAHVAQVLTVLDDGEQLARRRGGLGLRRGDRLVAADEARDEPPEDGGRRVDDHEGGEESSPGEATPSLGEVAILIVSGARGDAPDGGVVVPEDGGEFGLGHSGLRGPRECLAG